MLKPDALRRRLRFYFITDDQAEGFSALEQVRVAIEAGATMVQYRNKSFQLTDYATVEAICRYCQVRRVPFVVNDHPLLARAVGADGVHVGQDDTPPQLARRIMGPRAIVGVSVSSLAELERTELTDCDYIGTGPIFPTGTKPDAKTVQGLSGLQSMAARSPLPVVAIGGIGPGRARDCFAHGAAGVAVISCISRAANPIKAATAMADACNVSSV
ncbi:thiamine phosphate synthase [Desulfosarcina ovata]|uniref:Thiamine-phosphate synthase n=1 Tax=Desulfosarcina ovata subsp. ovata TaxID=2752305 RepID=A0A5K8AIH6_9BACT|nr:thiamine phosphate synthase [Desulfosarcina ovata]BBO92286.1 thiamine-phosphate synthase [Desulfosarcina ovata subsp. ovata]